MKKTSVLIADDHGIVRTGLTSILGFEDDILVVGEAASGQEAIDMASDLKPDVVIMDLMMTPVNGAEATAKIQAACPDTKVLILTTFGSSSDLGRAIESGAAGAVMKSVSTDALANIIRLIASGKRYIAPEIKQMLKCEPTTPELTPRQSEILASAIRGLTNEDIAREFGITSSCVKQHLSATFAKLGVANRAEAIAYAVRKQLLRI